MDIFELRLLPETLAVCRLPAESPLPEWALPGEVLATVRRRGEFTVVCTARFVPPEVVAERGWRLLEVLGPLDFSLVGVLARLAGTLAEAGVAIFVLSTYDTDLILVKEDHLERALQALRLAGHTVR